MTTIMQLLDEALDLGEEATRIPEADGDRHNEIRARIQSIRAEVFGSGGRLAGTEGAVEPAQERIAAWLESVSQGPSARASYGRTLAAEIRSGAWRKP